MEQKSAIQSMTIQGALLAMLGGVGSYLELAGKLPLGGAAPIVTVVGSVLSIIGRIVAKTKITGLIKA